MSKTATDADLLAAAEATQRVPTTTELVSVRQLAQDLVNDDTAIASYEQLLEEVKGHRKELAERTLPQALTALGLTTLGLDSGYTLELKPFAAVSVIKERQADALDNLCTEEVGGADLVKNVVAISFGRGEDEEAGHLRWWLNRMGYPQVEQARSVNHQSLNAWFRECVRKNPLFRLDPALFNTFVGQVAKLKEPKKETA